METKVRQHTDAVTATSTKVMEAVQQLGDTYLRGGGRDYTTHVDADLWDAVFTLRAAADRLDSIRAAAHSATV